MFKVSCQPGGLTLLAEGHLIQLGSLVPNTDVKGKL